MKLTTKTRGFAGIFIAGICCFTALLKFLEAPSERERLLLSGGLTLLGLILTTVGLIGLVVCIVLQKRGENPRTPKAEQLNPTPNHNVRVVSGAS